MPSYSYSSSTSFSWSASSNSGQTGHAYQQTRSSNPSGTTIHTRAQRLGEPIIQETRRFDAEGRQILEDGRTLGQRGNGWGNVDRRIEDVSDDQKERDRAYEERMEDEYAKREGGA
ncbi:uncharacterized protein LY89DRAFT_691192 [Mollisia scopiformis]|uniref:Uncharacterized protein n=1 Tax=Mollisia scopiformis TaxID=149040 RepID=A0A132B7F3_MOLSC|nr:uncharacterized protein LY89DRAFT_691192 [Mollisia scopiformis]KUJ08340.1 hypothetical protein LY89DRAFT_691192 [Mollisia scopiformis]